MLYEGAIGEIAGEFVDEIRDGSARYGNLVSRFQHERLEDREDVEMIGASHVWDNM